MNEFIYFMIGLFTGGFFGVMFMCMLQLNRMNRNYKIEDEKKND